MGGLFGESLVRWGRCWDLSGSDVRDRFIEPGLSSAA
jgi:hypothetical protein